MDTAFTAEFADGEYRFWLPLPQLFEFERKHGPLTKFEEDLRAGIGVNKETEEFVFVGGGSATAEAMLDLLRLALIGGNSGAVSGEEDEVGPITAKRLVTDYAYPARPIAEAAALAYRISDAAIRGIQIEGSKKNNDEPSTDASLKDKS